MSDEDRTTWKVYPVRRNDLYGYAKERFGVREEYPDGATRHVHDETYDTAEEAQLVATKFNQKARKGAVYDNALKAWR
jgi:hypothetical protein